MSVSQVPAATRAMRVLRFLAAQPHPVPVEDVMRAVQVPRSSAYHLLTAMTEEGFVVHLADEGLWGLGFAAFELATGSRQEPLQRIARRPLAALAAESGQWAHFSVLQACWDHNYRHMGAVWEMYGRTDRALLKQGMRLMIRSTTAYLRRRIRRFARAHGADRTCAGRTADADP